MWKIAASESRRRFCMCSLNDMECFIVQKENIDLDRHTLVLIGDEAHHATRSLRIKTGEELIATDLTGTCYRCRVESAENEALACFIEEILPDFGEPKRDILLIQGMIAQPSRWEFLLEKATELGVSAIQPVTTEYTERKSFNRERSERILRAAVKQTKRARKPELRELVSLGEALTGAIEQGRKVIILHEAANISQPLSIAEITSDPLAIAVGPEGGFSDDEVQRAARAGAGIVSLGPRRLRAETAAIAALAIVNSSNPDV
jgi:16S rRNA (uracil1498-N3)-methyltransferase